MSLDVNQAFASFINNYVNLDSVVVKEARADRDALLLKINEINDNKFFMLYPDINLHFGSFARKTKCKPLNDLDIMIGINGEGATYSENTWNDITITASATSVAQNECVDEDGLLNSTKCLNKFRDKLKEFSDLRSVEVKRSGQAITLNYKGKEWNFDIVPCFFTTQQIDGRQYYIISNGKGKWSKTDPRIDKERIDELVEKHGNIMLGAIRLFKFWNKHAKTITLPGYVMETLLLNYFDSTNKISGYIDVIFTDLLFYVKTNIMDRINDFKSIEGDINSLSYSEMINVRDKVNNVYNKAKSAIFAETQEKDTNKSINIWRDIFGEDFPTYG